MCGLVLTSEEIRTKPYKLTCKLQKQLHVLISWEKPILKYRKNLLDEAETDLSLFGRNPKLQVKLQTGPYPAAVVFPPEEAHNMCFVTPRSVKSSTLSVLVFSIIQTNVNLN